MGLGTLFGLLKSSDQVVDTSCKIAETATGGLISGLDKMFHTDEEKADGLQKGAETVLSFWDRFSTENSEQSKARRWLAKLTFMVFYSMIFLLIGLWRIDPAWCKESIIIMKMVTSNPLLLMVSSAYFIPHQLSKLGVLQGKK